VFNWATLITELAGLCAVIGLGIIVVRALWDISSKWTRVIVKLEAQDRDLMELKQAKDVDHTLLHERINHANERQQGHERWHMDRGSNAV
jgi:ABC-type nickel/cobalt efflux system permease component RcnA